MALVQLTNVIEPEIYQEYREVNTPEKSELVESGLVLRDAMFDDLITTKASERPNMPFWNDLNQDDEANYSDDSENSVTPKNVTAAKMSGRVCWLNQSWKTADLVKARIKSDPMKHIQNRTNKYWMGQLKRRATNTFMGILADNIANDAGDMVNDIHATLNQDVSNANRFSQTAFYDAAFTMGDRFDETSVIYMHSIVYNRLLDQNDAEDVRDSEGTLLYRTYKGHRVIIEDNDGLVTAAEGTAGADDAAIYRTIIAAPGAIAYGQSFADVVPVEIYRLPLQGNGGGTDALIERVNWIIHPYGYTWNESAIAGQSPSLAELAEAAQWTRVVERKLVPIAFLITNG